MSGNEHTNEAQKILDEALAHHKQGRCKDAIQIYNRLLNRAWADNSLRFVMADAYTRIGYNGLAINLLQHIIKEDPKNSQAWCNLGVAFRQEGFSDEAQKTWARAIKLSGDTVEVCSNMAGLYADSGRPKPALEWCDRALKCDPKSNSTRWQRALARLTLRDWKNGWKDYECRRKLERWNSRPEVDAPDWKGEKLDKHQNLYLHGEQGVGDEVMFIRYLDEVCARVPNITVEVNKGVRRLVEHNFPQVSVITDVKAAMGEYTHKLPIGSLYRLFFTDSHGDRKRYLTAPSSLVAHYRRTLEATGAGPYIACTWIGGTKGTNVAIRSMPVEELKPLIERYTCVSGQYEHVLPLIEKERGRVNLPRFDEACIGRDLLHQAALFSACDYVVTVAQTALHVAGAVGTKCFVLLSDNPDWRFGLTETQSAFYESVELVRKEQGKTWADKIQYVIRRVEGE